MPARAALALLCALAALPAAVRAAPAPEPIDACPGLDGLSARWSAIMDLFDTPGMAVAVVRDGTIYARGFGIRDPGSGAPVTPETLFYVASITKTYVAGGIEKLAGEGKLSLDQPVASLLPRFRLPDSTLTRTITVRDLMDHHYGITSEPIVLLDAYTGGITEDRYYRWLGMARVAGSLRYSNVHFTLLGRVIQAVSGEPWRDYLSREVFAPAGLDRTTGYMSTVDADPDHAVPCRKVDGAWLPETQRKTDRTMHAAGGLATNAVEGARWLLLNLGDGTVDGVRVLPGPLVEASREVQAGFEKPEGSIRIMEGYGLAWMTGTFNGHRLLQHGGGYAGTSAYMAMLPDDGMGVVVLMNAAGAARGLGDIVAIDVLERLTGTTSAWNVYDTYTAKMRKEREKHPAAPAPAPAAAFSGSAISRPAGLYTGEFHNPDWGTLVIERDGAALTARLGDAPVELRPSADGPDRFIAGGLFESGVAGAFLVGANGGVDSVRIEYPDLGEIVFRR